MPEKKVDPEDGIAYTYEEIAAHYKGKYKRPVVDAYWENTCYSAKGSKAKAKAAPKEKAAPKAKAKVKAKAKAKEAKEVKPVTLIYFPLKARGFASILALEVGNVEHECQVVQMDEWADLKASGKFPFDYLAGLELPDGSVINETNAVLFTIGKLGRLNGGSDKDFGTSTMLACKAAELFTEFSKVQPTMMTVKDWNADKAKALDEWKPKWDAYEAQFEKLCSDDGKFTKLGKTTGELQLYSLLHHVKVSEFKKEFSKNLEAFYARVEELDGVKKCLEGKSKMGDMANYVVPVP